MSEIALTPAELAEVKKILREEIPGLEVWAFGSRAQGRAQPTSDLDLAIIAREPLSFDQLARLRERFSASNLPMKVDMVDFASATPEFREIITRNKVGIQPGRQ